MKNVLFVMNFKNTYEGSFIRSVIALGEELQRNGGKAVYLIPEACRNYEWTPKLSANGMKVYYFNPSLKSVIKNTLLIKRLIKNFKIEIIHSHFADYRIHIPVSLAMAGKKNLDYIVHAYQEPPSKKPFYDKLSVWFTNATIYIAVSESIKNGLDITGRKSVAVPNAVDFSRLEFVDRNVKKGDYITNSGQSIVFMFGHDFESKGVDFVIRSLAEHDTEHRLQLLIAVSESKDKIEQSIKSVYGSIPHWITLLPPRNDVATYFSLADVFVSANRIQGSPYTMIECAYLGIPMIYCDVPGLNELNIPWSVKIKSDDTASLYKALCEIVKEEKSETYLMGLESKDYVINNFSLGSWVYEIINIYTNIGRI